MTGPGIPIKRAGRGALSVASLLYPVSFFVVARVVLAIIPGPDHDGRGFGLLWLTAAWMWTPHVSLMFAVGNRWARLGMKRSCATSALAGALSVAALAATSALPPDFSWPFLNTVQGIAMMFAVISMIVTVFVLEASLFWLPQKSARAPSA
jgi:hypothetical protein